MPEDPAARCCDALGERFLSDGGFSGRPNGQYRPDATAWAALALAEHGVWPEIVAAARSRLAADQLADGRVPIRPEHPGAAWPTSLAIFAWRGSLPHRDAKRRAVEFLLSLSGKHWPARPDSPFGHDTSIPGWPWIADTHSWVEPTSLAMLALHASGHGHHERMREGVRMLLDRQLPQGGWNYGNTTVFESQLRSFPDSTGMALTALAGYVEQSGVAASLDLLEVELPRVRTPLAIGWGLLGLGAWRRTPLRAADWLGETLARQETLGAYDTAHLALLLLSQRAVRGQRSPFSPGESHAA